MYGTNIIIIDELSMMSTTLLGKLSKRLQEITNKHNLPFGGCSVYLIGDLSQLPAVRSESLHHGVMNAYDNNNSKKLDTFGITGRNLFEKFHINFLKGFKRAENDMKLCEDIRNISNVQNLFPITKEMLNSITQITIEEMTNEEKFQIAPITVTSNAERFALLKPSLLYHSFKNGTRILYWKKKFQDKYIIKNEEYLYSTNFEELHGFFVKDMNCIIGSNQSTSRGVANGTSGTLHSIIWNDIETSNKMMDLINNTPIGNFVEVIIPDYVNIEFSNEIGETWEKDLSIVENKYVLPLPFLLSGKQMKVKEFKFTNIDGTSTILKYSHFEYEINTASTVHKMQGNTLTASILELNRRPIGLKCLDLASYFTALTRVRGYADLRIMPLRNDNNLDYLLFLHQDKVHVRYISHLENGYFVKDAKNKISKNDLDKKMLQIKNNLTKIYNIKKKYPTDNSKKIINIRQNINPISNISHINNNSNLYNTINNITKLKLNVDIIKNSLSTINSKNNLNSIRERVDLVDDNSPNLITSNIQPLELPMFTKIMCVFDINTATTSNRMEVAMETIENAIILHNEDIASLKNDMYLTDAILSAFFDTMPNYNNNYIVFPGSAYELISSVHDFIINDIDIQKDLIFPINRGHNHWITAIIKNSEKKIIVLDNIFNHETHKPKSVADEMETIDTLQMWYNYECDKKHIYNNNIFNYTYYTYENIFTDISLANEQYEFNKTNCGIFTCINIYYLTCQGFIPTNKNFDNSQVNDLRLFIYLTIKNGSNLKPFLDLVHIYPDNRENYQEPYGYKWNNNSCAFDSVLVVLSNIYWMIIDNTLEREAYMSTFPYMTHLNDKVFSAEMTPNNMKINILKKLFFNLFDGKFHSVYWVIENLIDREKNKFNKFCLEIDNHYTTPIYLNTEITYTCTCSNNTCNHIYIKKHYHPLIEVKYDAITPTHNHTLQSHVEYYFGDRVRGIQPRSRLMEYINKCPQEGCNQLGGEVSNINITKLPFMLTISDSSLINDASYIPGIILSENLTLFENEIQITYSIHAVIYILDSYHFITRFIHNNDIYIYDGMENQGIPIKEVPRNNSSLLNEKFQYKNYNQCCPVMYFYRKKEI
jgi:hypothetical protein